MYRANRSSVPTAPAAALMIEAIHCTPQVSNLPLFILWYVHVRPDATFFAVDRENELALLLVGSRGGQQPGRTRWSFFKNLPPGLLDGEASEQTELSKEGESESTWSLEKPQHVKCDQQQQQQQQLSRNGIRRDQGGAERRSEAAQTQPVGDGGIRQDFPRSSNRGGVATVRTDQEQAGRAMTEEEDQKRTTHNEKGRPCEEGPRDLAEQQSPPAERELAEDIGGDSPSLPACTSSSVADPEESVLSASISQDGAQPELAPLVLMATLLETLPADADGTARDARLGGVSSALSPPTCMRDLLEVKASSPGGKRDSLSGEGRGTTTIGGSAGLGVFCKRAIKAGDVVFEEEALLKVSKKAFSLKARDVADVLAGKYNGVGVWAVDLLQVVAFDDAPASVQARVLQLVSERDTLTARSRTTQR